MARPPLARERVLDAFESILIADGERVATLSATAAAAGVSKGGLLYHFGSKEELGAGMIERLDALVDEDVEEMSNAPEGPVVFYIRTSVLSHDPLSRAIIAVSRLAQAGSAAANSSLQIMRARWSATIRPHVRDEASLNLVMLLSDGLYFNNALQTNGTQSDTPSGAALDELIALVQSAAT